MQKNRDQYKNYIKFIQNDFNIYLNKLFKTDRIKYLTLKIFRFNKYENLYKMKLVSKNVDKDGEG